MFRPIAKNRWFIYAITALLVTGGFLWLEVQRDVIDADTVAATDSIIYVNKKPPVQNNLDTSDLPRDEVLRGWKTYRNEKYGFELKYPAGWGSPVEKNNTIFFEVLKNEIDFPLSTHIDVSGAKSLDEIITEERAKSRVDYFNIEHRIFAGLDAVKFETQVQGSIFASHIYVLHGRLIYKVTYGVRHLGNPVSASVLIVPEVLETFKFFEPKTQ